MFNPELIELLAGRIENLLTEAMTNHKIKPDQGDGFRIDTSFGHIQYRPTGDTNEIWWIESNRRGGGSELMELMLHHHPTDTISWGATSKAGQAFREKWHAAHPEIADADEGERVPFEGQFDPYKEPYEEDEDLDDSIAEAGKQNSDSYLNDEVMPTISDEQFAAVIGLHGFMLVEDLAYDPKKQTIEGVLQHQELGLSLGIVFRGSYVRASDGEWLIEISEIDGTGEPRSEHEPFSFDPDTDAVQLMKAVARLLAGYADRLPRTEEGESEPRQPAPSAPEATPPGPTEEAPAPEEPEPSV